MMQDEMRKKLACDSRENELQSCFTDPPQPHFVSQRTEDKSCVYGLTFFFVLEQLVRWGFHDQIPEEDTLKCMFIVLLALVVS